MIDYLHRTEIDQVKARAGGGDTDSQVAMGLILELGLEGQQDYSEAKKWWVEASRSGDGLADLSLANIIADGLDGSTPNPKLAKKFFEKAEKNGFRPPEDRVQECKAILGRKVLVVDSAESFRQSVKTLLEAQGFVVIEAHDGKQGLTAYCQHPDISIVFTDAQLDGMDGLTMLEHIRGTKAGKALPVIMLTQTSTVDSIQRAKKAGIQGWILKPTNLKIIENLARKFSSHSVAVSK